MVACLCSSGRIAGGGVRLLRKSGCVMRNRMAARCTKTETIKVSRRCNEEASSSNSGSKWISLGSVIGCRQAASRLYLHRIKHSAGVPRLQTLCVALHLRTYLMRQSDGASPLNSTDFGLLSGPDAFHEGGQLALQRFLAGWFELPLGQSGPLRRHPDGNDQ